MNQSSAEPADARQQSLHIQQIVHRWAGRLVTAAIACLILSLILLAFVLGTAIPQRPTVDSSLFVDGDVCDWPGCGAAPVVTYSQSLLPPQSGRVGEKEGYRLEQGTFTHTQSGYLPDKDTYLVPSGDGWQVESDWHWDEHTYDDGEISYVTLSGSYCAAHDAAGRELIESAIDRAYLWGNPWLWLSVVLLAVSLVLLIARRVRVRLALALARLGKEGQAAGAAVFAAATQQLRQKAADRRQGKARRQEKAQSAAGPWVPALVLGALITAVSALFWVKGVLPNLGSGAATWPLMGWVSTLSAAGVWLLLAGALSRKPGLAPLSLGPLILLALTAVFLILFILRTYG